MNPANPGQTQTVTTSAIFNGNDERTQEIDVYGHPTVSKYDGNGRVTETDDILGNATKYLYDARNQIIETIYPGDSAHPNGTITKTVYDAEERVSYTDDRHDPSQTDIHGTHTIYDSDGNVIETDQLDGVVINITTTNGVSNSQLQTQPPPTVLSSTSGHG